MVHIDTGIEHCDRYRNLVVPARPQTGHLARQMPLSATAVIMMTRLVRSTGVRVRAAAVMVRLQTAHRLADGLHARIAPQQHPHLIDGASVERDVLHHHTAGDDPDDFRYCERRAGVIETRRRIDYTQPCRRQRWCQRALCFARRQGRDCLRQAIQVDA